MHDASCPMNIKPAACAMTSGRGTLVAWTPICRVVRAFQLGPGLYTSSAVKGALGLRHLMARLKSLM